MSPVARNALAQVLIITGLAISIYLAAVKFLALPCIGAGGCHAVINSRFGEIFHVPVGVYSTFLWLAIIYVPDRSKRGILLLLMSGVSAVMMLIQFFVLRGFCPFCTLHALTSWAVLWLHAETPRRWTALPALVLGAAALLFSRQHSRTRVATITANATATAVTSIHAQAAGLYWLGPFNEHSPALVLSLDCPACLDLLESLTRRSYAGNAAGPALYFKTTDTNRELTTTFIAAVLSQDSKPRDAFLAAATLLLTQKDIALASPATAARQLAAQFPDAPSRQLHAQRILADQTLALHSAALGETTPLLVPREGRPKAFFKIEDLFQ